MVPDPMVPDPMVPDPMVPDPMVAATAPLSASATAGTTTFGTAGAFFIGSHFSNREAAFSMASRPMLRADVTDFRSLTASPTPLSLAAASIALVNSRDIDRALAVNRPSVRNITGNSLGPTTTSATTPITKSSDQPISSMDHPLWSDDQGIRPCL